MFTVECFIFNVPFHLHDLAFCPWWDIVQLKLNAWKRKHRNHPLTQKEEPKSESTHFHSWIIEYVLRDFFPHKMIPKIHGTYPPLRFQNLRHIGNRISPHAISSKCNLGSCCTIHRQVRLMRGSWAKSTVEMLDRLISLPCEGRSFHFSIGACFCAHFVTSEALTVTSSSGGTRCL